MNGAFLLIPLFLIRYGLLYLVNRDALSRAAYFSPMHGVEKAMYLIYQAATFFIIIYSFFLDVNAKGFWFYLGLAIYLAGISLFILSAVGFAKDDQSGFCQNGLYRVSRNPMYVAYDVYFLGCALLTQSWALFVGACIFIASGHWIILSEERWCRNKFGEAYTRYMKRVRRYF